LLFFSLNQISAQVRPGRTRPLINQSPPNKPVETSPIEADTVFNPLDSVKHFLPDSLISEERDIDTAIKYSATDSVVTSVDSKIIYLYGNAKIIYGDIELEANEITVDYNTNLLHAKGNLDSLGRRVGYPIFKNGEETFETREITYNFVTKQARITEVVTTQGDGYIHGEVVLKNRRDEILSLKNSYTTCNLAHPHYRIRSTKTKAIPNDKIVSGPFNLEILDVPTPIGFPFGMFPSPRKSASGILMPTYGEEARRGFYLKNGGYFFDLNDYFKLSVTGDLYSRGSWGLKFNTNYNKRYHYTGNLNFSVTKNRIAEKIEAPTESTDYLLTWSHSPKSKGTGRFSANVNAATSSYTQNNYLGVNYDLNSTRPDNTTRNLSSSVSYSKQIPNSPVSLGISGRHNQDLSTGQVDITLPDFYATVRSLYPFKNKSNADLLKNINMRYNMKTSNRISNRISRVDGLPGDSIAPFSIENIPIFYKNSKKGIKHSMPFSTSFDLFSHLKISPGISYDEIWYFEKLVWEMNPEGTKPIVVDTLNGFNRVYDYSGSVSMNTRIYGTYLFKKGKVKALRHTIAPSLSFSYSPDFTEPQYDYYQKFTYANGREEYKSRYSGFLYGSPGIGESRAISFGVSNTFEMKVLNENDTTADSSGPATKKVSLIKNISANASYNMAADSLKLSPISLRGNTSVFNNKLNITLSGTLDPYVYVLDSINAITNAPYQRKIDQYAWQAGEGIGHISSASLGLSTNLNPKKREQEQSVQDKIQNSQLSEADKQYLLNNPDVYVDFSIPWSLRLNYSMSYSKRGYEEARITNSLNVSGDLSLSEKWKIAFRSGYDFSRKDFTMTNFTVSRDLHCWELNLGWTPFGVYTSYDFTIRVKSALLQDLKINRKRSFYDL